MTGLIQRIEAAKEPRPRLKTDAERWRDMNTQSEAGRALTTAILRAERKDDHG